ncbi:hypothetical protein KAZ66_01935 [Candidatus Woesebacteria bacterium]|nr:hypothetical protein [Candidatus Woesebacteria bacterium]
MDDNQTKNTNPSEELVVSADTEHNVEVESVKKSDDIVEEAEEVMEIANNTPSQNKAVNIIQLENIINGYLGDLERLQQELKEQSQMFRDALENDAEYAAVVGKAREISKEKKTIQDKLIQDPALALVDSKVKDIKGEVKETQQALSDYLQQYYEQSGLRQITGTDGEIRDIVTTVKLVKKKD